MKDCAPPVEPGGRFTNPSHPLANIGKSVELEQAMFFTPVASIISDVNGTATPGGPGVKVWPWAHGGGLSDAHFGGLETCGQR